MAPRHCTLLIEGASDSHQSDNKSEWPRAPPQCSVKLPKPPFLGTEGDMEAVTSYKGKERSNPEHPSWSCARVRSSAGSEPPGRLRPCLIGASLFTAVPLPSPSPKQTDAYDPDRIIAAKLVTWRAMSWHRQVQCTQKGAAAEGIL